MAMHSSGIRWLDTEIGGFPQGGVVTVGGGPRTGKTSFALGFALAECVRAPVCIVTSDGPEAVVEHAATYFERDLNADVRAGRIVLLQFAPFFENKVRSAGAVNVPLDELKSLISERGVETLVFDTLDPIVSWIGSANAKSVVRLIFGQLMALGVTVLCTLRGDAGETSSGAAAIASLASGLIELDGESLVVKRAAWCGSENLRVSYDLVYGRGLVAHEADSVSLLPATGESGSLDDVPEMSSLLPPTAGKSHPAPLRHGPHGASGGPLDVVSLFPSGSSGSTSANDEPETASLIPRAPRLPSEYPEVKSLLPPEHKGEDEDASEQEDAWMWPQEVEIPRASKSPASLLPQQLPSQRSGRKKPDSENP